MTTGKRFLAEFELYVMLAIARLGEGAYGAAIRQEIQRRTGRPVSIGAVYATLGRLNDKELLSFSISAPQPIPGGRSRKHALLTASGKEALQHSARMMARMMEDVEILEEEA